MFLPLLLLVLSAPPPAAGKPGDKLIAAYLSERTAAVEANPFGAESAADWERAKPRLREQYLDMLGLWPLPERTPLNAKVTGLLVRDSFVVEKLHYQSKPGLYVTGNLYRPKKEGRYPAVLYVCGHSGKGRDGNKTAFQQHGMWFATNGYVCLIVDTLQLGEIPGIHHGTYREGRWWWHSAGYTSAGVECWNGVRGIDYLVGRPDVDADRIAVTGISGGGAATFWIAAADERVKVAVPVSGMADLKTYVDERVVNGHCDCMFLYNTYRWNWMMIAELVVPRPLLFANSDRDRIFPMPANERIRETLESLYALYGPKTVAENFAVAVVPGGHDDKVELRLMAYRWINKHLKKDNAEVSEPPMEKFSGADLRAFPTDADIPGNALNGKIDQTFVPRANVKVPDKAGHAEWKKRLLAELRTKCFGAWRPMPNELPGRRSLEARMEMLAKHPGGSARGDPREGIDALMPRLHAGGGTNPKGEHWLVVLSPGERPDVLPEWAKAVVGENNWATVTPRGADATEWTVKNPPNTVERSLALLGETTDSGRVWDVAAAAHVTGLAGTKVRLLGRGRAGIIAAYAALYEDAVVETVVVDPPTSHMQGPHFLGVLRLLDIPDALGLSAPKPLTIIGTDEKAFEKTARIYRAAGCIDGLELRFK